MDNINPYHNYGDLPIIHQEITKIFNAADKGCLLLPNHKERWEEEDDEKGLKKWDIWHYGKYFGFNTCPTKEDLDKGNSLPTLTWDGKTTKPYTFKEKATLKKDGTPYPRRKGEPVYAPTEHKWIYNTQIAVMEYFSKDIQSFWEYCNLNRQVCTGITHKDRFVVVGDFDIPFTKSTIQELEAICSKYSIPHFTYLEEHLDSGHYQIGWILDEPFNYRYAEAAAYTRITRYVWDIFGSDANFKGWHIKNPNCNTLTRTHWYNDVVSKDELVATITNAHKADFSNLLPKIQKEEQEIVLPTNSTFKPNSYVDCNSSRNCCLLNEIRDWMLTYDKENGDLPAHKDILKKAYEIADVLGRLTHKGMLPSNEIEKTIKSAKNFVIRNRTENGYSQRQKFGNLIRGCEKESNILDVYTLWKKGYKRRKIQEELGLKIDALNKYIKYVKDHYETIEEGELEQVIPNTIELSKINKTIKYKNLIEDVKRRLSTIRTLGMKNINI